MVAHVVPFPILDSDGFEFTEPTDDDRPRVLPFDVPEDEPMFVAFDTEEEGKAMGVRGYDPTTEPNPPPSWAPLSNPGAGDRDRAYMKHLLGRHVQDTLAEAFDVVRQMVNTEVLNLAHGKYSDEHGWEIRLQAAEDDGLLDP